MKRPFEEISPEHSKPERESRSTSRRDFMIEGGITAGALAAVSLLGSKEDLTKKAIGGISKFFQRREATLNAKGAKNEINIKELEGKEEALKLKPEGKKEKIAYSPEEISDRILEKYHEVFQKENFLPKEVFTRNFFIATQLQESNFKPDAESDSGAVGIMQVMPITIKEVVRFLHRLNERGAIKDFYCCKVDALNNRDIKEIIKLIKNNADYGRAFGKLYFADLYKLHKIGKGDAEKGNIRVAQKKLLASYNWDPTKFKRVANNEKRWPKETQDYHKRVFRNMNYLERFQEQIAEAGISSNIDYMSMRLVQAMNSYTKIDGESPIFDKLLANYVSEIKIAEDARLGRRLRDDEIDRIIKLLKDKFMEDYLSYLNDPQLVAKI